MVLIPAGIKYTTAATGARIREIHCRHCGTDYFYEQRRNVVGVGTTNYYIDTDEAKTRARKSAEANLRAAMAGPLDLVRCPSCKRLQPEMIRAYRGRRLWGASITALVLLFVVGMILNLKVAVDSSRAWERSHFDAIPGHVNAAPPRSDGVARNIVYVMIAVALLAIAWICYIRFKDIDGDPRYGSQGLSIPPAASRSGTGSQASNPQALAQARLQTQLADVKPAGWINVRPSILRFPHICCGCAAKPSTIRRGAIGGFSMAVPFCGSCAQALARRQQLRAMGIGACLLLPFAVCFVLPQRAAIITALLLVMFSVTVVIACFRRVSTFGFPVHFKLVSFERDEGKIRFDSPAVCEAYVAFLIERSQATAPKSTV